MLLLTNALPSASQNIKPHIRGVVIESAALLPHFEFILKDGSFGNSSELLFRKAKPILRFNFPAYIESEITFEESTYGGDLLLRGRISFPASVKAATVFKGKPRKLEGRPAIREE